MCFLVIFRPSCRKRSFYLFSLLSTPSTLRSILFESPRILVADALVHFGWLQSEAACPDIFTSARAFAKVLFLAHLSCSTQSVVLGDVQQRLDFIIFDANDVRAEHSVTRSWHLFGAVHSSNLKEISQNNNQRSCRDNLTFSYASFEKVNNSQTEGALVDLLCPWFTTKNWGMSPFSTLLLFIVRVQCDH